MINNEQQLQSELDDGEDSGITITAGVRVWDTERLIIDYTLRNDTDTELVALDAHRWLQVDRLEDGRIRVFRGLQETPQTDFEQEPTIQGRELAPGARTNGSGSLDLPLTVDYPIDDVSEVATDVIDFCIGYADAETLSPAFIDGASDRHDEAFYLLNADPSLQRLSCTTLARESESNSESVSPLDDTRWENTLERVIETLYGNARGIALEAANDLQMSGEPASDTDPIKVTGITYFSTEDGGGEITSLSCENGGGFEVVSSGASYGVEYITAQSCILGALTIEGGVTRETDASTGAITTTLTDFSVDNASLRTRVSEGVYHSDEGELERTTTLIGMSYSVEEGGQTRRVTDLDLQDVAISGTAFDRILSASFSVTAPWTNDAPLSVSTPVPFSGLTTSLTGDFTQGALEIITSDNESLRLDVDSGRPGEVMVTLVRGDAVTSLYHPWPEGL